MKKLYVKDLKKGEVYEYQPYTYQPPPKTRSLVENGIVQYVGPFQKSYKDGSQWKCHRFLWIKKPIGFAGADFYVGRSVIEIYGDNVRGSIKRYTEDRSS